MPETSNAFLGEKPVWEEYRMWESLDGHIYQARLRTDFKTPRKMWLRVDNPATAQRGGHHVQE